MYTVYTYIRTYTNTRIYPYTYTDTNTDTYICMKKTSLNF
jgi:hypothetical protein